MLIFCAEKTGNQNQGGPIYVAVRYFLRIVTYPHYYKRESLNLDRGNIRAH